MSRKHKYGSGDVVNNLEIIKYVGKSCYEFRCYCGTPFITRLARVVSGVTTSCGCLGHPNYSRKSKYNITTYEDRTIYLAWWHAKDHCINQSNVQYKYYGGRGIKMDSEWLDDFAAFKTHIGPKPSPEYILDRIDNNGNYEPGNVRWATPKTSANNKRDNRNQYTGPIPQN